MRHVGCQVSAPELRLPETALRHHGGVMRKSGAKSDRDNPAVMRYTRHLMRVITEQNDLIQACQTLSSGTFVTVDTEFLRETTYWPELCLIQIANADHELIIDPLSDNLDLAPFFDLMANRDIEKVFHAARQDIEIFVAKSGAVPEPIFDTQIAAMVCGFGESISYSNLVKTITDQSIDKSSRFTDWAQRPLTEKQLTYAIGDVTHLREVYRALKEEIENAGRAGWLAEEMATLCDKDTYITKPEDAWRRLKLRVKNKRSLANLIELAAWREAAAQNQNVPRGRLLKDDALYDIANQSPKSIEELRKLRTVHDGIAKSNRGREIVSTVKRAEERDFESLPPLPRGRPPSAETQAILELLKVLLKACAAQNRVAPKLIATSQDLEKIASGHDEGVAALTGWRKKLFGQHALKLRRGELALGLRDGEVVTIETNSRT